MLDYRYYHHWDIEAKPAGRGDAGGEAAGNEEIVEPRRLAHDRLAVGADRDRSVDHRLDPDIPEGWHACQCRLADGLKAIEIARQQFRPEIARNSRRAEDGGAVLPSADRKPTDLRLRVEASIGVAHRRQIGRQSCDLLGDRVLMLERADRNADSGHATKFGAPHPGRVDDRSAFNRPVIGDDMGDPASRTP